MASQWDLTTLASTKSWLGQTSTNDDPILASLISSTSQKILGILNRGSILPTLYSEVRDSPGFHNALVLRHWPVVSVSSVFVDGYKLSPAPALPQITYTGSTYSIEQTEPFPPGKPVRLYFRGVNPSTLKQATIITYTAGYQVSGELIFVPSTPFQVTAAQPFGPWANDVSVIYSLSGIPLLKVASAPAVGQYTVVNGLYTFNSADVGEDIELSYGYIPAQVSQACTELVSDRYKFRSRIGERSRSLGGQETISYDLNELPTSVMESLHPYMATFWPS